MGSVLGVLGVKIFGDSFGEKVFGEVLLDFEADGRGL